MSLKLTDEDLINGVVTDEVITSFTIDLKNQMLYIIYDRCDVTGEVIIPDVSHTISGPEFYASIVRASEITGGDVYAGIKQALYEYLPGNGVIS